MKDDAKTILTLIEQYLEKNPSIRFTQALFNLGITEFSNKDSPTENTYALRDPYNDTDQDVLIRMSKQK